MAIRNTDTNPNLSSGKLKSILSLESEIDAYLLKNCNFGKTSYLVQCNQELVKILVARYTRNGWNVEVKYTGENLQRLEFTDPEYAGVG